MTFVGASVLSKEYIDLSLVLLRCWIYIKHNIQGRYIKISLTLSTKDNVIYY